MEYSSPSPEIVTIQPRKSVRFSPDLPEVFAIEREPCQSGCESGCRFEARPRRRVDERDLRLVGWVPEMRGYGGGSSWCGVLDLGDGGLMGDE